MKAAQAEALDREDQGKPALMPAGLSRLSSLKQALGLSRPSQQRGGAAGTSAAGGEAAAAAADAAAAAAAAALAAALPRTPAFGGALCLQSLPKSPILSTLAHRGGCTSLAFQSPGRLVATGGQDKIVRLWDLGALESSQPQALTGMLAAVNDVAFTCDGERVVGAGADKSLRVWDVRSGQTRHTLTGHAQAVSSVCCSPSDPIIAVSCSEDRSIKVRWRSASVPGCPLRLLLFLLPCLPLLPPLPATPPTRMHARTLQQASANQFQPLWC